ncbi:MAG: DUF3572 domain-containing protein [Rhizobiales bacterium]|nr:DUF3572 domain-containing protein [Hyphomicrobiales bacterium]MBI3673520.1 DUF3572 domain-containing protein [Hyphomicrobiales bacterium]
MYKNNLPVPPEPDVIALKVLTFLASDEARIERFLGLTGIAPQEIRAAAAEPWFLKAVLDYLLGDESLLLVFAGEEEIDPAAIGRAARQLSAGRR